MSCCQIKPGPRVLKPELKQDLAQVRFERVALDIMGPIERSIKGNAYLVVIQDYFSKWLKVYAVPDHTAKDRGWV